MEPLSESEQHGLLVEIGRLIRAHSPDPAAPAGIGFAQVGGHTEVQPRNTEANQDVTGKFEALRAGMYRQGRGTWLQARFVLAPDGTFDFDFYVDGDPQWSAPAEPDAYRDELETFPREDEHIPDWWRLRVGLPLGVRFRRARPAEVGEEREPLPDGELPLVLQYLEREALVGDTHRTDGTWLWPETVPHQLRRHGIAPEPELVAHIRELGFQPPYVEHLVRRTAEADLLGQPRPRPGAEDGQRTEGDVAAELETSADPELSDEQLLVVLVQRLGSFGVWPQAYRIGAVEAGKWCLSRGEAGWTVTSATGAEQTFTHLPDAAQQLLGALLLHPARLTGGRETPLETAKEVDDWPIQPAAGDPPLTLLRNKRLTRLPEGTVVLRFGEEPGNLVHHGEVRFATTSLPLERERVAHTYRLRRSLHVVTGVTVPWANLPGGAVAYVLPKPIAEHESDGSLERIE
ncbi:TNT domain-containing protein [Amycolatopsis sp. FDAARGOS 1241]|uniref:TNT domain-containing protein n=1 Tax=Amycolatopsis sp. FDAARGOS 1241 TaxID=2778070 RepID=UPI00194F716E|nr:TNT domain-containing protein [Amycolatopsis sp. FDAARGOS 1241]QRP46088.1 TNT domain-containing protein [Amycolatopsis sp. FDAARGOS 1241]